MYLFVILFYRREVYRILQEEGIDLPRYAVLNRDPDKPDGWFASSLVMFDKLFIQTSSSTVNIIWKNTIEADGIHFPLLI